MTVPFSVLPGARLLNWRAERLAALRELSRATWAAGSEAMIDSGVVPGHALSAEALFEDPAATSPVELPDASHGAHGFLEIPDGVTGRAVVDDFRDRARAIGNDRCVASHGFDHYEPEGLGPIDRKQQRAGVPEKIGLLPLADFAHVFDQRGVEQSADAVLEVLLVCVIEFSRYLQRHFGAPGNFDGAVHAFLGRDAADECKVISRFHSGAVQALRESVVDGSGPVCPAHGPSLRVGDGYEMYVREIEADGGPDAFQAALRLPTRRFSTLASGGSSLHQSSQGFDFARTVRRVNRVASNPFFTCPQLRGIDTGAPGRARGDHGATAVAIRSLRR